ncbi:MULTISPECIES: flagellar motor switch protein FliG [unclassified Cryobacterium]|uniref:flagellar motor switch protein FliG n=1 Tax=unclassified Cryobacterium TaxID=2649013 RepID=UPI002AB5967E|nr:MULTISPECIES: flagellar motor switch protein FliG [unclassified Cryobacterium]MDY7527478.1 flagellar motor switch protein FliG [Cryobacterium sp. 10C2]MEB0002329.1 flagellar motor switch protein FliG [Cryobacterium sp. RTC2.1]MEB0289434.1 flagellar motor switch protein FliG [Cryobacterium sp. 10C2]
MIDPQAPLTGTQKVAIVLMNMEHDRASEVMKQFTEAEAADIAAEMVQLRRVDTEVAETTVLEFHDLTMRGTRSPRGGHAYAVGLLEASFGAERAAGVMSRVASSMAGKAFEFLDTAEPLQVLTLLDGELPQTIALVLAHLRPEHASAVIAGLEGSLPAEVAQCIAGMGTATPEAIRVVTDSLKARVGAVSATRDSVEVVGGIQPLVEIINRADVATERSLLEALDARDPALAEQVRARMLTFADIVRLEDRDVQQVLRGIDAGILAIAMKGSTDGVVEIIRKNLSERNREILDDEIRALGPVRVSQVEEGRATIVRAIRDLEAQGSITVTRADEDAYVV